LLTIILYTLFILACIVLVVSVLLQPGKSGAGDLFTSSVSSTAFGPRGTQTVLAKITVGAAAVFLFGALLLGIGIGGAGSVMEGVTDPQPAASPAAQTTPQADGSQPAASPQGAAPDAATTPAADASPAAPAAPAASPQTQASPAR
jgi:preprotein translocase subunit SecG